MLPRLGYRDGRLRVLWPITWVVRANELGLWWDQRVMLRWEGRLRWRRPSRGRQRGA